MAVQDGLDDILQSRSLPDDLVAPGHLLDARDSRLPGDRDRAQQPVSTSALTAALALTGHEAEAREALQDYRALPSSARLRTTAGHRCIEAGVGSFADEVALDCPSAPKM